MIRTILVGCDLSVQADVAIERAIGIAQQHGASITLVNAQSDDGPMIDHVDNAVLAQLSTVAAAVRARDTQALAERLETIRALGIPVTAATRTGPPGEVLADIATETRAELIVVGTHGATGITRLLLGSVAAETVRNAPCDVLVVRGAPLRAVFAKPLVAMDFSPAASRALTHTVELALPDANIAVLHAWQLPVGSWGASFLGLQDHFPWKTVRDAVVAGLQQQADELIGKHASLARRFDLQLVQGPPASTVTTTAERDGHDLVVVGTHGHRGFRRLLLGSVADAVIRHAPCSVLIVHGEHAGETANFPRR